MRCEGWRRHGGVFTFGPVRWEQCKNEAIVKLKVKQEKVQVLSSCQVCWDEGVDKGIKILAVTRIRDRSDCIAAAIRASKVNK